MWVSRCHSRIGSVAGTVYGRTADPLSYTRAPAKDGMNRATSSVSSKRPSSHSCMATTEVTGLVIE